VNDSCGCVEGDVTMIRRRGDMLNVCFGCGQPATKSGSLPIYDSKRKVRFTNVGPLVAVQRLRINVCARCFGRLLLVRLIPWIAFAAFLLSAACRHSDLAIPFSSCIAFWGVGPIGVGWSFVPRC
jgi:hypothetical protein